MVMRGAKTAAGVDTEGARELLVAGGRRTTTYYHKCQRLPGKMWLSSTLISFTEKLTMLRNKITYLFGSKLVREKNVGRSGQNFSSPFS